MKVENTKVAEVLNMDVVEDVDNSAVKDTSKRFVLVREAYAVDEKSGNDSYSYFVEGKRGERTYRIQFLPRVARSKDNGGNVKTENRFGVYNLLDLFYEVCEVVYVQKETYSFADKQGEVHEGVRYCAVGVDSSGIEESVDIELLGTADKKFFELLCSGFGGLCDANSRLAVVKPSDKTVTGEGRKKPVGAKNVPTDDLPF